LPRFQHVPDIVRFSESVENLTMFHGKHFMIMNTLYKFSTQPEFKLPDDELEKLLNEFMDLLSKMVQVYVDYIEFFAFSGKNMKDLCDLDPPEFMAVGTTQIAPIQRAVS